MRKKNHVISELRNCVKNEFVLWDAEELIFLLKFKMEDISIFCSLEI